MFDARARHLRRLRRLRRAAQRWSLLAGGFGGAAVVLVPYHGLGWPDAMWAAAAGFSGVATAWRWADLREFTTRPVPEPVDPAIMAEQAGARLAAAVERLPAGRAALSGVRRQRARLELRGSAAAGPFVRLDEASATLAALSPRLTGPAASTALEAAVAERSLRDLARRAAAVEKALPLAAPDAAAGLRSAHQELVNHLESGVTAYERLVAAAAEYVAEDGRTVTEHPPTRRLADAADLLRGVAAGLAELRGAGHGTVSP